MLHWYKYGQIVEPSEILTVQFFFRLYRVSKGAAVTPPRPDRQHVATCFCVAPFDKTSKLEGCNIHSARDGRREALLWCDTPGIYSVTITTYWYQQETARSTPTPKNGVKTVLRRVLRGVGGKFAYTEVWQDCHLWLTDSLTLDRLLTGDGHGIAFPKNRQSVRRRHSQNRKPV